MEENKKFNLKDYALWCEKNQKPVEDEKSLSEYKLSLEKENSLKKAKNDEKQKILNDNFVSFIKSLMVMFADDEHIEDMKKLSNSVFEDTMDEVISSCIEATIMAYGKTLVELMTNTITAIGLLNPVFENAKGENEND